MKTTKRILATLLAVFMLAAMLTTGAFAAAPPSDGWITIEGTVGNATYSLYKMFEIETAVGAGSSDIYYYKPTPDWVPFFTGSANGTLYGTMANSGYIVWENQGLFSSDPTTQDSTIAAFAKHALAYAKTLTADVTKVSESVSITIDGLDTGAYYLVSSSLGGTALAGPVDANGLVIKEKNNVAAAPTILKTVGPNDAEYMSVDLGTPFNFKVVITLNENVAAGTLVFTDVMPKYIDVTAGSLKVSKNGAEVDVSEYTVTRNVTVSAGSATHQVEFHGAFTAGDVLTLVYEAQMVPVAAENLPVAHEMYTNLAKIEYGDVSVSDTASVFTLAVNGYKFYTNDVGVAVDLKDAKFVLKNSAGEYYNLTNNVVSWKADQAEATVVPSDANGEFSFLGIAAGEYTLVEIEAPVGYTGAGETKVTVNRTLQEVSVENIPGTGLLPETGGMGTTIFYIVGAVLVLGAVTLLVTKKRANG